MYVLVIQIIFSCKKTGLSLSFFLQCLLPSSKNCNRTGLFFTMKFNEKNDHFLGAFFWYLLWYY